MVRCLPLYRIPSRSVTTFSLSDRFDVAIRRGATICEE